jgi:protein-S-isoprenylcysteine O-methyltransferase Ste14
MIPSRIYNATPDATLICSIILAYLCDHYFPIVRVVAFPLNLVGWIMIVLGLGAAIYIIAALRSRHTSTDAAVAPSELLTGGFYAVSRNPFYLLYVIVALGVTLVLGSLAAFIAPVICFAVLNFIIIPLEEGIMQQKFGKQYLLYKNTVRRWL